MYVEGMRLRPRTYRFQLPEGVSPQDCLFLMSGACMALTPRDYAVTQTGTTADIELVKDAPMAGGAISVFAYFNIPPTRKSRGQPSKKS